MRRGLEHAKIAGALDPVGLMDDLVVPRLLDCLGRQKEAGAIYDKVFSHDPTDLFILSEMYLRLFARRDVNGLKALAARVGDGIWRGEAPMGPDFAHGSTMPSVTRSRAVQPFLAFLIGNSVRKGPCRPGCLRRAAEIGRLLDVRRRVCLCWRHRAPSRCCARRLRAARSAFPAQCLTARPSSPPRCAPTRLSGDLAQRSAAG
jgi:hypothetical protein